MGLSIGTAIVPLINRWLFDSAQDIGPSLAIVALFSTTIATILAFRALSSYGKLVTEQAQEAAFVNG